jgi:endonuclease-3 related protein
MSVSSSDKIKEIVTHLNRRYGTIEWWSRNPDEVMIGAILTQQTRWETVEKAMEVLKRSGLCSIGAVHIALPRQIEDCIRCTGFYRVKGQRLKNLAAHIISTYGDSEMMHARPTGELRESLFSVNGIGEETADSILCYGFGRTSFVVDAYTVQICGCAAINLNKKCLKRLFEKVLTNDNETYRQAHAHIVEFTKGYCLRRKCGDCVIRTLNG